MIRKIMTAEERDAKDARNKRILALIIGLVMLFSTASYAFFSFDNSTSGSEKIKFNNIEFVKAASGYWEFTVNEQSFTTLFNPQETTNISAVLIKNFANYPGKPLYFGINSKEDMSDRGNTEILRNLGNYITKYQLSCLTANCSEDYAIKDCSVDNVIIFSEAETSRIYEDSKKCVIINYAADEEEKVADAFLFKILGIN